MIKSIRKKRLIYIAIFLIIFIFIYTINVTTSRYLGQISATKEDILAVPVLTLSNNEEYINITDMYPGDTEEFTFSVSNFDSSITNEVLLSYYFVVYNSTNSMLGDILDFTIEDTDTGETILDGSCAGTQISSSEIEMPYDERITHNYKLTISWNSLYNSYEYADQRENINLKLEATQVINT